MAAKDHLVHTRGLVNTRAYSDELWKNFGPGDYGCKGPLSTYARGLVHTRAYSDELWKNFGPGDYGCRGPPST